MFQTHMPFDGAVGARGPSSVPDVRTNMKTRIAAMLSSL